MSSIIWRVLRTGTAHGNAGRTSATMLYIIFMVCVCQCSTSCTVPLSGTPVVMKHIVFEAQSVHLTHKYASSVMYHTID